MAALHFALTSQRTFFPPSLAAFIMVTDDDENDCCVLREKVESERLSHHMK
jgi:hypothetical protein